ncbi:MAG: hypothetical protein RL477_2093, partial [Pseudomonadota bacterium]
MADTHRSFEEPRFFFLMPVWGKRYIDYLLTFGLPTLMAPGNIPSLPNLARSEFIFITRSEDEAEIRGSKLFASLAALVPIKFIFLDFYESDREEKFNQLGMALKLGAGEALGRGYCLFLHPDGLYSDGMMKYLYGVARSGKKACVTHGPNASMEKIIPYLRERGLLTHDAVNPLGSRQLARALLDNLHPDTSIHCMGNPHYPRVPYMGFWLSPKLDGALFRFISLHPWMVDLRHLTEIMDFTAIDHNFVRNHGFVWSDVHVETDSDNILVIGMKPENERNAIASPSVNASPEKHLRKSLRQMSNCNYSRFCFFHGLKVHVGDLDNDWYWFEVDNLRWLNGVAHTNLIANEHLRFYMYLFSADGLRYYGARFAYYWEKFHSYAFKERRPRVAFRFALNVVWKGLRRIFS